MDYKSVFKIKSEPELEIISTLENPESVCVTNFSIEFLDDSLNKSNKITETEPKPSNENVNKQSHTEKNEFAYKCDVCYMKFPYDFILQEHKRIHNGNKVRPRKSLPTTKRFKCDVCEKAFDKPSKLLGHRTLHTGEKKFQCDFCDTKFREKKSLKIHRLLHTGEKPFKCNICGLLCTRQGQLKQHILKHTGERPFKCDLCGVGFIRGSQLSRHKLTHTGERPFQCDRCPKTYCWKANLREHELTHTELKCDACHKVFHERCLLTGHKCDKIDPALDNEIDDREKTIYLTDVSSCSNEARDSINNEFPLEAQIKEEPDLEIVDLID